MGVDPDQPSLQAARAKSGAHRVQWVDGTARSIPPDAGFEVAIMSSNVVQEIIDDDELVRSFGDIAAHLASGGRLAFDARDPDAPGWEAWTKERSQLMRQHRTGLCTSNVGRCISGHRTRSAECSRTPACRASQWDVEREHPSSSPFVPERMPLLGKARVPSV